MAKRAISSEEKTTKREKIMSAAVDLLSVGQFPLPSVSQILEKADEAKGTAYLYFKSKEEIYLSVMSAGLTKHSAAMIESLELKNSPSTAKVLARSMTGLAKSHPKETYLAVITPLVLESNVTDEFIVQFKSDLLALTLQIAQAIHERDGTSKARAKENFLISYNLFIGMWQHSVPTRHVQKLIEENDLLGLQYNFEKKYLEILEKIWMD